MTSLFRDYINSKNLFFFQAEEKANNVLEEESKSPVSSGFQLFSAYRQGLVDPESISTQPVPVVRDLPNFVKPQEVPTTSTTVSTISATGPRIPTSWLKPKPSAPSTRQSPVKPIVGNQPIPIQPPRPVYAPASSDRSAPSSGKRLLVNSCQRGNPLLELLRNVVWEYSEIEADYLFGPSQCAFFLSLRYHNLHPEYIFNRLQKLNTAFQLKLLIVLVDVDDAHHPLKEINKFGLTQNVTVLLAWSSLEAARYLETYKVSVNKPPDDLIPNENSNSKDQLVLATAFFTSLRFVSKSNAAALLTKFGTIVNVIKADIADLESCPGIGSVKALKIYETLRASFKRKDMD